jgi:hypothetical protein
VPVPIIVRAAVLVRARVEPQPEFAFPIAIALLGDFDDRRRLGSAASPVERISSSRLDG